MSIVVLIDKNSKYKRNLLQFFNGRNNNYSYKPCSAPFGLV